ncbi:MAG: DUF924 domain-containing protein [Gammaproteobacteria bacterium]|nr:DUF924 domain-containing protein [Gammaproteobacteria bacterium]MBU1644889.1 DUF924 domain-containing protein [Gammaproteobacteria bacterium]MBU1971348.1 DUF924 domain-containing protein [Gammaproteobacteria bacterium]
MPAASATLPPDDASAILDFWFLPADHLQHGEFRREWFRRDDAFDATIRDNFAPLIETALAGGLGEWEATAAGALARILLLDQFTRNSFRGTARAFAGDAAALAIAERLVGSGRDKNLPPLMRWFAFMPFEHSETLIDQERSVALFAGLRREGQHPAFDSAYDYAVQHRAAIERFGRFPGRNAMLGRISTPEELAALDAGEFRF